MKQKHKYIHYTHTCIYISKNTRKRTDKQANIHDKKANSLGWILFNLGDLAQLICSIGRKQWTQAIFGYNKFLKKSSCANIDLWLNRHEIEIGLTFFDNHGRTSPKNVCIGLDIELYLAIQLFRCKYVTTKLSRVELRHTDGRDQYTFRLGHVSREM